MSKDPLFKIFGCGRISGKNSSQNDQHDSDHLSHVPEVDGRDHHADSQDLFSSHSSSMKSLINQQIEITLQLTEFIWVQCDNPDCQKWRRVPVINAENIADDPWYCSLNPDPNVSFCQAPEEDQIRYDRMAKKAGIKYVMSMLSVGALVWAKMDGYCRWPALVTGDPESGVHVMLDIDGDPHSYHVEFLGNPHTHSWVKSICVQVYGHKTPSEFENFSQEAKKRKKLGKGRWKKKSLRHTKHPKNKKSYKSIHITDSIQEADFLLTLFPDDRLKYCKYIYKSSMEDYLLENSPSKKVPVKQNKLQNLSRPTNYHQDRQLRDSVNAVRESRKKNKKKIKDQKENSRASIYCQSYAEMSLDDGISVPTYNTKPSGSLFDSPNQFSQSQLRFQNSLVDKTKEEKFSIDIDNYRKNEQAFEHDVRRFMSRNGQHIRKSPCWHHVPVRLFQLYLAVHDRGGFVQVTKNKQWTSVYKELTEQQHTTVGTVAKQYYQRNLYPFELYMSGQDYVPFLTIPSNSKIKKLSHYGRNSRTGALKKFDRSPKLDNHAMKEEDSVSEDIEAILGQLEDDFNMVISDKQDDFNALISVKQEILPAPEAKRIKFHDESTDSPLETQPSVPSEFRLSTVCDLSNSMQNVPDIYLSGESLSDVDSKILHQMKVLEEDMKEIARDMEEY